MHSMIQEIRSPLFDGIAPEDRAAVLSCTGYHIGSFRKGETIVFEQEHVRHVGILLSGSVDMVKEDLWGNRTMILRIGKDEMFGETFACGADPVATVSFVVSQDTRILFIPFDRVMRSCSMACGFHHRLTENMVGIMVGKSRDLLQKIEVISKRTLREKILAYLSIQSELRGDRYFEIPLGRLELAEYLCADRSALTRELSRLKEEGVIDYDKNMFRILS